MKKQYTIYFALAVILIAGQACSVGGTAPSTQGGQETVTTDEQTTPVATTVPSQAVAIDGPPGPETIDLTSPALYVQPNAPAYRFESTIQYAGVDTTGVAKEVTSFMAFEAQTQPQPAQRFVLDNGFGESETIAIDDQVFMVVLAECSAFPDAGSQDLSAFMPDLQEEITGQAPRVETGIEVNGFVTDKYELSSENLVTDDELISASVYVARNSGYIALFELQGRTKTDSQGLDPNQLADFTRADKYIPGEAGSLSIAIPAGCQDQAGLAGEFPVMDGALASSTAPEVVFYQIEKPAAEVADFYRAEMPNRGWALTEDTIVERVETESGSTGPVVTLVFTKDGKNFMVKVDGGGPITGVTIKEK
jgi:hypothetical protein